jgi:hypothetical protein
MFDVVVERIDEAGEVVVAALRAVVGRHGDEDAIRRCVVELTRIFVHLLRENHTLTDDDVVAVRAAVAHLGPSGLSDAEVAEMIGAGKRRAIAFISDLVSEDPPTSDTIAALKKLLNSTDDFLACIEEAIQAAGPSTTAGAAAGFDTDSALVLRVLGGDEAGLAHLGVDDSTTTLDGRHGVLLVIPPAGAHVRRVTSVVADGLAVEAAVDGAAVFRTPQVHGVVMVSVADDAGWERTLRTLDALVNRYGVGAVVVPPASTAAALRKSYQDARRELAWVGSCGHPVVLAAVDYVVCGLIYSAGLDETQERMEPVVSRLAALSPKELQPLLETLDVLWTGTGRVGDAAYRLRVTERTVRDRLDKIHRVTGLDPSQPADRWRLDVARFLLRLIQPPPGSS